ncbi:MAG TPA: NADPH-dependent F420 reductase [Anaerolineaceae bacterium]|nr:NADPH-dependent F420 reductase [Anaerolineaceae bacterium]
MTENEVKPIQTIAILGGTGKEGKGLAYRWARAGYTILIGSRQAEKAQVAAADVLALLPEGKISGISNADAASQADLVVLTVPFSVHKEMLSAMKSYLIGKILIDVTVPIVPPKVTKVQMPPAGSAAQEAREILGEQTEVVAAFQNISYEKLIEDEEIECDVLVCGSSKAARTRVLELVRAAGMVGWDAGPIENSVVVEGMTSILLGINRQFGVQSAGIRITGVPRS